MTNVLNRRQFLIVSGLSLSTLVFNSCSSPANPEITVTEEATAVASNFTILTENAPPTNYLNEEVVLVGSSTEIVQEILARIGWSTPIQVYPWARAYETTLEQPKTALFSTTRTAEREPLFKWVGPIFEQRLVLYKLITSPLQVETLEDAKNVGNIGTYIDDAAHQYLKQHDFTNLDAITKDELNLTKLFHERIQLWATGDASVKSRIRNAGFNPEELEEAFELKKIELYIAFSYDTPNDIITLWQTTLDTIKTEGLYQQILEKYANLEQ